MDYNSDIDWEKCEIRDVLYYEQPTKYIVTKEDYNDSFKIPVLTAGKSFILGYTNEKFGIFDKLPCIIFDDFTTDIKYVDFQFKVKSSAMKILNCNTNANIKYVFNFMKRIKVINETHKRYWISDYSKREIILPSLNYQNLVVGLIDKYSQYLDNIKAELN